MNLKRKIMQLVRRYLIVSLVLLMTTALAAACGGDDPTPTPTATPIPAISTPQGTPTPTPTPDPFEAEWLALISAAQAEGKVVIDAGGAGRLYRPVYRAFGEKFAIEVTVTSTGDNAERIVAEQSAGKFLVDVIHTPVRSGVRVLIASDAILPMDPLLVHPEVVNKDLWFGGRHWYSDLEGLYLFNFAVTASLSPIGELFFNTNVVNPEEIKNREAFTFWDIIDPAQPWAGKVVSKPPVTLLSRWGRMLLVPELGRAFDEALLKTPDINWVTEGRLIVDGLVAGKYALTVMITGSDRRIIDELIEQGLPIRPLFEVVTLAQSRTIGGAGSAGLIAAAKNPPHPNAQKLLINWWLSREGQTFRQELSAETEEAPAPTLRIDDIPQGKVLSSELIQPDVDYVMVFGSPEIEATVEEGRVLASDLWKCIEIQGPAAC